MLLALPLACLSGAPEDPRAPLLVRSAELALYWVEVPRRESRDEPDASDRTFGRTLDPPGPAPYPPSVVREQDPGLGLGPRSGWIIREIVIAASGRVVAHEPVAAFPTGSFGLVSRRQAGSLRFRPASGNAARQPVRVRTALVFGADPTAVDLYTKEVRLELGRLDRETASRLRD